MKALEEYAISKVMPQEPVSDPQLSPDGSLIAFTYTEVNYDEGRYYSSIWITPKLTHIIGFGVRGVRVA